MSSGKSKRPAAAPAPVVKKSDPLHRQPDFHSQRFAPRIQQAPAPPSLPPVPTNGKPRKNQAGMSSKELEHFRDLLLQKRREILGDVMSMEKEALRSASGSNLSNLPLHMADMGTDNYEQEFTLGLVEKDRVILREINSALAKIMDGSYGTCEGTGKPISKVRLEAQPWARFSIDYARQMERGFMR
jgi:RNA polymerase-binding protein DksA